MAFRKGWRQQQLQQWPRRITNMRPNSLPFPKQLLLPAYQGGTTVCNTKSRSTSPVWSCRSELELSLDNGRSVQLTLVWKTPVVVKNSSRVGEKQDQKGGRETGCSILCCVTNSRLAAYYLSERCAVSASYYTARLITADPPSGSLLLLFVVVPVPLGRGRRPILRP